MANKDPPQPSADEKAQYEKTKDELVRMLAKKRAADRQLVSQSYFRFATNTESIDRRRWS